MPREHWVEVEISRVADVFLGSTPSKKEYTSKGKYKVIKFRDLQDGDIVFTNNKAGFVNYDYKKYKELLLNDVLITSAAHSGENIGKKTALVRVLPEKHKKVFFTGELLNIRSLHFPKWIYYYFLSVIGFKEIQKAVKGVHLTSGRASLMMISIAPLAEQNRIIEKLDAILPNVKNVKSRLDKIPQILKRFRQSVLAYACSGKLTEDWREDNRNSPDWELLEFFDFFVLKRGYDLVLSKIKKGKYPVLTSAGIGGYHNQYKAKTPGVITGRSGSVGKVHYIEKDYWPHNTTLFVKDFKGNLPKYIYYFLLGFDITEYSASTAVPTLNRNNLRNIMINVPPLEEQHEIVRRVEKLFHFADSLEVKYKKAMQRVEKIEQSVLAKAFRGELAPQDPNDEPAEELLKRILSEKAKLETVRKKSKRSRKLKTRKLKKHP
jgi:type I restriction enzyme S subunit